jgi:hypothetical protein
MPPLRVAISGAELLTNKKLLGYDVAGIHTLPSVKK